MAKTINNPNRYPRDVILYLIIIFRYSITKINDISDMKNIFSNLMTSYLQVLKPFNNSYYANRFLRIDSPYPNNTFYVYVVHLESIIETELHFIQI